MPARAADRRTGGAAVAGGLLLAASVAAELVHPVQSSDGSVLQPGLFAVYLSAWTVGAAALLVALLGLGGGATGSLPRAGRIGRGIAVVGAALLVGCGGVGRVAGLISVAPAECSFLLFAVGALLFLVAAVPLALGLRRAGAAAPAWLAALVSGVGVVLALGIEADPWHDLGLFVFCGAWVVLGLGGLTGRSSTTAHAGQRVAA